MREIACPGCGHWLDVPPEYADRAIRCGHCRRVIQPHEFDRAETAGPPRADDRPPPSRPARERTDDDRPAKPAGSRWWVWALLVGGLCGACCCGGVLFVLVKAGNPDWQPFTAPGGEYAVEFPGKPQAKGEPAKWPDGTATTSETHYAVRLAGRETYAVQITPLPPGVTVDGQWEQPVLNLWLFGLKNSFNATFVEESRRDVEVSGVKGKEVTGTLDDPKAGKGRVTVRIFLLKDKCCLQAALIGADTPKGRANVDHFMGSLTLTKPDKSKPKGESDK